MTIHEQLNILSEKFNELYQKIQELRSRKNELVKNSEQEIMAQVNRKFAQESQDFQEAQKMIVNEYKRAEKYTRVKPDGRAEAVKPDLQKLQQLHDEVDTANTNLDDPAAGEIMQLLGPYKNFLPRWVEDIKTRRNEEIMALKAQSGQMHADIDARISAAEQECRDYLQSDDVSKLVGMFNKIHERYEIDEASLERWAPAAKPVKNMQLGFSNCRIMVPSSLEQAADDVFGEYYDPNDKALSSPVGYTINSYEVINAEYTQAAENRLLDGIRALIFNYMRFVPINMLKISVFDMIGYDDSILGDMSVLTGIKHGVFEPVPADAAGIADAVLALEEYYSKVESKIGDATVYEYNAGCDPRLAIPIRVLIIRKDISGDDVPASTELERVIEKAEKLGMTVIRLNRNSDGAMDTPRAGMLVHPEPMIIDIISDNDGKLYYYNEDKQDWIGFRLLSFPQSVPNSFIEAVKQSFVREKIGTSLFKRYKPSCPVRSGEPHGAVKIPFGVDGEDEAVSCIFDDASPSAFISGAAKTGKTALLNTLICGITANYHPDEAEIWLMDVSMSSGAMYAEHRLPHIKYLLLDKSPKIFFDMLDRLDRTIREREYLYSQKGYTSFGDVPANVYLPAVFVIIDEFPQIARAVKAAEGQSNDKDYCTKLRGMLVKAGRMGIRFIFAGRTYSEAAECFGEAEKYISQRFVLSDNEADMQAALMLTAADMTDEVRSFITAPKQFECLYRYDSNGSACVKRADKMFAPMQEMTGLFDMINSRFICKSGYEPSAQECYTDKKQITVNSIRPKTFKSQIPYYQSYEKNMSHDLDEGDVLIYAGVAKGFEPAAPFIISNSPAENILIAGSDADGSMNVLLSVLMSYRRIKNPIEIWAHDKNILIKRYKDVFSKFTIITDPAAICGRVRELKENVRSRTEDNRMVVVLGFDKMIDDLRLLADDDAPEDENRIYDIRSDLDWTLKRAGSIGLHFTFCCVQPREVIDTRMDMLAFRHKLVFALTADESRALLNSNRGMYTEEDAVLCISNETETEMRPHIYVGIPNGGWIMPEPGKLSRRV
ncbi:FtsK/SpoIIIE domain-containing protein [uncultured Ruminococcus sp.]|uniref:FtsK/SpoIIIE domain-containing protein n=1 Tax=uncultured Ruminococcus sp. TaxID=165186 RepID=UPI0025F3884C|nr:FtsK/SpoIIIE domain-containing protein [uncultured Ruminococcus sp.]